MNRLKQNRAASFVVIACVYVLATIVGVMTYRALCLDWWLSLLLANTVLFFVVSIPMADARQSRKQGFAEYKQQTRMLLPIKK